MMMGLFSAPHCVGMCGGLIAATSLGIEGQSLSQRLVGVLKYNFGRLFSYSMLGIIAGVLGASFAAVVPQAAWVLRLIAAVLVIFSGLYISGWWLGLRHIEQGLFTLWNKIKGVLGARRSGLFIAGIGWGCLPCGLVYTALSMAMARHDVLQGGLFMLSFGLGTLPVLVGVGLFSASAGAWLKQARVKATAGLALIGYGIWTLYGFFNSQGL
jgi:sulfite exporter TauE/SafE